MMPASPLKAPVTFVAFGAFLVLSLSAPATAAAQPPDTREVYTISFRAAEPPAGAELFSRNQATQAAQGYAVLFTASGHPDAGVQPLEVRTKPGGSLTRFPSSDRAEFVVTDSASTSRGLVLPVLYGALAGLQAYDAWSTVEAAARGASENNPFMVGVAGHSGAVWAVKVGSTIASIYVAEGLWRRHRRVEAIAMMAAVNGVMAAVTAFNASVLRGL